ncbi:hypothetical protein L3X38_004565 [Prunus dulcis]|uniref:Uncharacterized protein n=1 Tax=Prunus dulcis TaxID=3755 RepID=A0AAD4ZP95_PRUDU|nr:hypothetical protein L3X38_004565 [Prunus dulcis]
MSGIPQDLSRVSGNSGRVLSTIPFPFWSARLSGIRHDSSIACSVQLTVSLALACHLLEPGSDVDHEADLPRGLATHECFFAGLGSHGHWIAIPNFRVRWSLHLILHEGFIYLGWSSQMLVTCFLARQDALVLLLACWFLLDLFVSSRAACRCVRHSFSLHLDIQGQGLELS